MAESVLDDGNDGHRGTDVVLFILKETRPAAPAASDKPREIASHCLTGFSSAVLLSPPSGFGDPHLRQHVASIADGNHGFERGEYATIMALTAGVSMTVHSPRRLRWEFLSHVR